MPKPYKKKGPVRKVCLECEKEFTAHRSHAVYCSAACKAAAHRKITLEEIIRKAKEEGRREYWREEWKRNGPARRKRARERKQRDAPPG